MNYNFCTLFDSHYLTRGLALYNSLKEHCTDFHIYIFAFDDKCYSILCALNLQNATIISLHEFENLELLKIKPTRTIVEYCWSSTASTIRYSIDTYNLDHCTYLDADLLFFSSPDPIFNELSNYSIGITSHNFSPNLKSLEIYGKYCVQFVYFKNDCNGNMALNWWLKSCIDWCYAKLEHNRYGDQKYLDYFQEKFNNVHVIKHLGAGVAPWNISSYQMALNDDKININNKNRFYPLIFYHFQGLQFEIKNSMIISHASPLKISKIALIYIYSPYINHLINIKNKITHKNECFDKIIFKREYIVIIAQFFKNYLKKISSFMSLYYLLKRKRYSQPKGIGAKIN